MSTLLVSEVFPPQTGGTARWFWEIYRRLPRKEYLIAAGLDKRQEEFDRTHDLRVLRLPLALQSWGICGPSGLRAYFQAVRRLYRIICTQGVRQLHCGRCLPEGLMARLLQCSMGIPYICYVHGEEMKFAAASRELAWLTRWVLRGANFVIANSRNTQAILTKEWRCRPGRIRLMHPGVDTQQFVPVPKDPKVRASLGWGDRPVILTAGRLQKRKGHDTLILALDSVRRTVPDVLYAILGDGEERKCLEALVARTGMERHVQFLGEADDRTLVKCYQQCDLFVLPNRQVGQDIEGFGIVLVEAQACGKPVVAGTSGGTADTMRVPDTGRVVCCDGQHDLAALLTELLSAPNRLEEMGRAARQWAAEQFDWGQLSQRAARIFREMTAENKTVAV
ncbi:MAG: glycosyltransferase family 4 protein [Planctomycetes bacterium]|nr:glycosyltransferase family 4 protein [Planctomycetota bacterium]